jgi:hypothetical protein
MVSGAVSGAAAVDSAAPVTTVSVAVSAVESFESVADDEHAERMATQATIAIVLNGVRVVSVVSCLIMIAIVEAAAVRRISQKEDMTLSVRGQQVSRKPL